MVFYRFSFGIDADNAFYIRTAEEIQRGNYLLKGWYGGFYNPWTTDFFWIAILRHFLTPKMILYSAGSVFYAITCIFVFLLINRMSNNQNVLFSVIFTLPIFFVPVLFRKSMLSVGIHTISITYLVFLFLLISFCLKKKRNFLFDGFLFLIMVFCHLNDEWTVYFFALPLILVLIVNIFVTHSRKEYDLIFLTAASIIAEKMILKGIDSAGGMSTRSMTMSLIAISDIPLTIMKTIKALSQIFNISFSDDFPLLLNIIRSLGGLLFLFDILFSLLFILIRWNSFSNSERTVTVGALFSIGVYLLTGMDSDAFHPHYLVPFFILGVISASAVFLSLQPQKKESWLFLIPLIVFTLFNFPDSFSLKPVVDQSLKAAADKLVEMNIQRIYTPYWESHTLWYYSNGAIEAAAIEGDKEGHISPHRWAGNSAWYVPGSDVRCVLLAEDEYLYRLNEEVIRNQFGNTVRQEKIGDTNLYCFDSDLSDQLFVFAPD